MIAFNSVIQRHISREMQHYIYNVYLLCLMQVCEQHV